MSLMFYSRSNNHRNTNLSPAPRFINGGGEPVMNGGIFSSNGPINTSLSLLPTFNGGAEPVMNTTRVFSNSYSPSHVNTNLSLLPTFNVGGEPLFNSGLSSNFSTNTSLPFVPGFNLGGGPVIINGVSSNYPGLSLSGVATFNFGGEPMGRRSLVRNYHSSYYSPNIVRTIEILRARARLLSALSTRRSVFTSHGHRAHYPQIHSQNLASSHQLGGRSVTITELENNEVQRNEIGEAIAPTPLRVYYPPPEIKNEQDIPMSDAEADPDAGANAADDNHGDEQNIASADGVTHSLPYRKYGPYTCPRCLGKFSTSQLFAAHVSSHYKYETKAQKRRRLMAKIRRRNLRLHNSREGLTILPTEPFAQGEEGEEPVDMAEAEAGAGAGARGDGGILPNVQVKAEPADF